MLGELYKYAKDNDIIARPGFKKKNVKYYICLGIDGSFLGFDEALESPMCPDIGSLANGTTKSNLIAEKAEVILNFPDKDGVFKREKKHQFYIDTLTEAGEYDKLFEIAAKSLSNEQIIERIKAEFSDLKCKTSDFLSLKVDGKPLESSNDYLEWWENFRKSLTDKKKKGQKRCLITGELTEPLATVPVVSGLFAVGGHSKGDSLICFDKDAFRSYGLEQSANAAVSETAMTGVNLALEKLLNEKGQILAGAKNIHWFSEKTEDDPFELLDTDFDFTLVDDDDNNKNTTEDITLDEQRINDLFRSVYNGVEKSAPENKYYMLSLSGVNGRVMIRNYDEGYYDDLYKSLHNWYEDLTLITPYGKGNLKFPKLWTIYTRLLKFTTDKKDISKRIAGELSGISSQIIYSAVHNTQLPDAVAVKALAYIRSSIYSDDDTKKKKNLDGIACQILKIWLNRKYKNKHKEEFIIMDKLNENSPSVAYNVGRLMAVYAALQSKALGDVGAGVVERYYTSCCTSPALVIGKLSSLSQYHLSKLDKGAKVYYSKLLQEISDLIGTKIPKTFSLEEQSEFALGYYSQTAKIYSKTNSEEIETEE